MENGAKKYAELICDCVKQINLGNYLKHQLGQMEMNESKLPMVDMRRSFLNLDWALTEDIINFTI
jgi:hypothetical protein